MRHVRKIRGHFDGYSHLPMDINGDRVGLGLDPKVADLDGDGDLDIIAFGRSGLSWLENLWK